MKYQGLSSHAGTHPNFPAMRFLRQMENCPHPCITLLPGSFGWSMKLVKAFEEQFSDRPHLIETYLSNGCARRRGPEKGNLAPAMGVGDFNRALIEQRPRLVRTIKQRIDRVESTVVRYAPTAKHVFCLELEDNMSDDAADAFRCIVEDHAPEYWSGIVRNPCMGGKGRAGCRFVEHHGRSIQTDKGVIHNTDGWSFDCEEGWNFFQDFSINGAKQILRESKAYATFLWIASQQGYPRNYSSWSAPKPPKDQRKYVVTDTAIEVCRGLPWR